MPTAASSHRARRASHRIVVIWKLGRFAGPIGSRAAAAKSSSRRVRPAASITAEALRHLGLAEDSAAAIKASAVTVGNAD
jgi:hypothetical protein